MSIMGVTGVASAVPAPTREEMVAIVAARPAALQQQLVAVQAADRGTSGQGTPAVDPSSGIDVYL
jgi:hypothetical protein